MKTPRAVLESKSSARVRWLSGIGTEVEWSNLRKSVGDPVPDLRAKPGKTKFARREHRRNAVKPQRRSASGEESATVPNKKVSQACRIILMEGAQKVRSRLAGNGTRVPGARLLFSWNTLMIRGRGRARGDEGAVGGCSRNHRPESGAVGWTHAASLLNKTSTASF